MFYQRRVTMRVTSGTQTRSVQKRTKGSRFQYTGMVEELCSSARTDLIWILRTIIGMSDYWQKSRRKGSGRSHRGNLSWDNKTLRVRCCTKDKKQGSYGIIRKSKDVGATGSGIER